MQITWIGRSMCFFLERGNVVGWMRDRGMNGLSGILVDYSLVYWVGRLNVDYKENKAVK